MNLHDVARQAGVSIATVSRVLNGIDLVRPQTRAKVLRALEELDYDPNMNARALSMGDTRTLGMIVSNLQNAYFLDVYHAFETEANRAGYEIILANTDYSPERLESGVRKMVGRRVSGVAVVVSEISDELILRMSRGRIPLVISGVAVHGPRVVNIQVDCRRGMQRLVEHLKTLGHRRIAFVDHHSALESISDRRGAFLELVAELNPESEPLVVTVSDTFEGGREAARKILTASARPTAIICVNDLIAVGLLRELRERRIAVPGEISVTGFDNTAISEYVTPALTTIHIPREKIGRIAFEALGGPDRARQPRGGEVLIDVELVVRDSTGPAR